MGSIAQYLPCEFTFPLTDWDCIYEGNLPAGLHYKLFTLVSKSQICENDRFLHTNLIAACTILLLVSFPPKTAQKWQIECQNLFSLPIVNELMVILSFAQFLKASNFICHSEWTDNEWF